MRDLQTGVKGNGPSLLWPLGTRDLRIFDLLVDTFVRPTKSEQLCKTCCREFKCSQVLGNSRYFRLRFRRALLGQIETRDAKNGLCLCFRTRMNNPSLPSGPESEPFSRVPVWKTHLLGVPSAQFADANPINIGRKCTYSLSSYSLSSTQLPFGTWSIRCWMACQVSQQLPAFCVGCD